MRTSFFPSRASLWNRPAARRERRRAATLRATRLAGWETLGLGLGQEALEQRSMLAADLLLSFDDNIAAQVDKTFYSAGSQVVYKLTVENKGDATATAAQVTTTLSTKIDAAKISWFATYTGGGTGSAAGASNVNTAVTLPAGSKAVFQIAGTVKADATGDLVSTANVAVTPGASNSRTDVDRFVPRSMVVADGAGFAGSGRISLVDPQTGASLAPAVNVFSPAVKTGVRVAMGDLDADGKDELVAVPGRGTVARIEVFKQLIAADGTVMLVRDPRFGMPAFEPDYDRGANVAVSDFDNDGKADIAVAKAFGDGEVKIFRSTPNGAEGPLSPFARFTPFPGSQGGARIAAADFGTFAGSQVVDAGRPDGKAEIAVASGVGSSPVVKVYSVASGDVSLVRTIRPFTPSFTGGLDIAVGRIGTDSIPEIILAQGIGGTAQVQVANGRVDTPAKSTFLTQFTAFTGANRSAAVSLAGVETAADGRVQSINVAQVSPQGAAIRKLSTTGATLGTLGGIAGSRSIAAPRSVADTATMTTASGLQFTRIVAPTGKTSPTDASTVNVDYTGVLLANGTVFDSGTGSSFTVTGVVPGFREVLKLMKEGEVVNVTIPAALGYGAGGAPGKVPANADLLFRVRLNSFK
jgi:uncharacterized repeat protein (TIGR01451 family)